MRSARRPGGLTDLYTADSAEARRGGGFRWFFSTCLAAAVGSVAILAAIFGASDPKEGRGGIMPTLHRISRHSQFARPVAPRGFDGLEWAVPKSDRLEITSRAMVTRYIVQESLRQRRGTREYIHNKPYARIVAHLAAVPPDAASTVPPFNPFKLYGNPRPVGEPEPGQVPGGTATSSAVSYRVVELLGSILPTEDGQELDAQEVSDLVDRAQGAGDEPTMRPAFPPVGELSTAPGGGAKDQPDQALPTNTTVLAKTGGDSEDDDDDVEGRTTETLKVQRGETLTRLLQRAGADPQLARSMVDAARSVRKDRELSAGSEVELTLEPSLQNPDRSEPVRFVVRDEAGEHQLTVMRNSAGEFVASATPLDDKAHAAGPQRAAVTSSVYASLYHAALMEGVSRETIGQILQIHAYETDYRRRARPTDEVEFFFDMKDDGRGAEDSLGELLYSAITVGGVTHRYYRFRSADGKVDFFDERGNNSRKFLIKKPIRSDEARLTSGFGYRFHPLLNTKKMHTGVDWASHIGTPIIAAGDGVIEEAGPKGQYGNYIRIRHANGYQTAYGHMSRFAPGSRPGVHVRQGQIIGYVGNTGFSTGPHLHFEVLVNKHFVDPMTIHVPRERQLKGRDLVEFQKERARIDDLLRRRPVKVAQTPAQ